MNEKLINEVIRKIESQQKGKEGTAVYGVGEQLKDICRTTPGAAELVLRDLDVEEMSIDKCEKKIKERADELRNKLISAVNAVLEQYSQDFKQELR